MNNEKDVKDTGVVSQEQINEAIKDTTQSEYYQQNRIPLLTGEYRKEAFLKLKGLFLKEFYKAIEEEEKAWQLVRLQWLLRTRNQHFTVRHSQSNGHSFRKIY